MIKAVIADYEGNVEEKEKQDKVISSIEDYLISLNPPADFGSNSSENIIRRMENSFEQLCASLEQVGVTNPKELSVFEFYNRIEYFESKKPKK